MVIVNTVVYVRSLLGLGERDVALALTVFGAGSMIAALALPRLLDRLPDRPVMLAGAAGLVAGLAIIGAAPLVGLVDAACDLVPAWPQLFGGSYAIGQVDQAVLA
jgi:MFS family permease